MLTTEQLEGIRGRCASSRWRLDVEGKDTPALLSHVEELARERGEARRQLAWIASLPCSCNKSSDDPRNLRAVRRG